MDFVLQSTFLGWTGCRVGMPCISLLMCWMVDFFEDVVWRWSLNFGFVVLLCPMLRWGVFRSMGSKFLTLPTLERVSTSSRFEGPAWQSFLISSSSFSFGPRKLNDVEGCYRPISLQLESGVFFFECAWRISDFFLALRRSQCIEWKSYNTHRMHLDIGSSSEVNYELMASEYH